ncbi:hypothetical protein BJEO58_01752 [Brevibacterium jeotgali]|uniref:Uncharacterized protein n=2 Tax=Brevibacterium jeotgali TaxID=1262550 RepID=A0A2H1L5H7_9MICO|nr:hypothetical protein FB108_0023 [Brevibacterium jeotgali]SMY12158.1 hypothetical protein BJEO58_01752 [Brevibacterium jeotgali]
MRSRTTSHETPMAFPAPPEALKELMAGPLAPQRSFTVPKESWIRKFSELQHASEAIAGLPTQMNRDKAIASFSSHWPEDAVGAFTATMAWAYGERAGYAGYRVARILTASSRPEGREESLRVRTALRTSLEVAVRDGAIEGFSYLNDCTHKVKSHQGTDADHLVGVDCGRIYGLGPSFFTKWLHIGTLALSQEAAPTNPPAPMLDNQAISWLKTQARLIDDVRDAGVHHTDHLGGTPTTPEGDLLRLRSGRTDDYGRYVALLSAWGEPYGLRAVDVCDRIYRLIRDDGEEDSHAA